MESNESTVSRINLAYFSHSYRPEDKELNLFFWELLSRHHLYFTVDSEENKDMPMHVSYLEWMMRRSACFVAVIPRREDSPPCYCSPYQVFENGLAIRAGKPRLIFVEAGLDETLFGIRPGEVYAFRRHWKWLEQDRDRFAMAAKQLAEQAHAFAPIESELMRPVALMADRTRGAAYCNDVVETIERVVVDHGYSFRVESPEFVRDFLFLQKVEQYSILISEIRRPYIAPDVLGLMHGRCIPTIRICHLEDHESPEKARSMMCLSNDEAKGIEQSQANWPLILSRYGIDRAMEPVIFWKRPEELKEKLSVCLRKITEQRRDLTNEQEARNYFLRIGRLKGKVFISNARTQNDLAKLVVDELTRNAVEDPFHYRRKDAIDIGSEWLPRIKREIKNSTIFVALIDDEYDKSEWCKTELEEAMDLYRKDQIEIHAYLVSPETQFPQELAALQISDVGSRIDSRKADEIVEKVVGFLEGGEQVNLGSMDRERIVGILEKLPTLTSPDGRRTLIRNAGLPTEVIDTVRVDARSSVKAATEIVDGLASWRDKLGPHTRALGLLLSHTMGLVSSFEEQAFLMSIIRDHKLMPDARLRIKSRSRFRELGLAYIYEWRELGTFESVERGSLKGTSLTAGKLSADLYAMTVKLSAEYGDWQKILKVIGTDIIQNDVFKSVLERLKGLDSRGFSKEQLGFCFATDTPGLRVPFEWAVFEGHSSPLCLQYPVRRFLLRCPEPRRALRAAVDVGTPLRVLLVASNTGSIDEVEDEIEELYLMFKDWFSQVGWPESNICKLSSQTATVDRIEREIRHGHYHILHFAGHGGYDDGKPVLQVYEDTGMQSLALISATTLRRWVFDSDLRFVYLSTCRGAATEVPELGTAIRCFENIAQAVVEAHVPEVIGFVWPIYDSQSRILAARFYRQFLESIDANLALYQARTLFEEEKRIWAAPVLIQQLDSYETG
jgi:hypothetical protein